jgi:putative addiction module component (TIGR02574 family)
MDTDLTKEVLNLPIAERIELVYQLWDSILDNPESIPLTDAQRAELDRRLARYEQDPSTAVPWEEVRKRLWDE